MSATIITAFDACSLAILGLILTFISHDLVRFMEIVNMIGIISCFLFLMLAPESPQWLIMKGKFKEGIDVFNYLAWANGSKDRIPPDAQIDIIGQILKENKTR